MKTYLYQLYDEQGRAVAGAQGHKKDVLRTGQLHGAAHMWIWRRQGDKIEVLLQRRGEHMLNFPNLLDVSAAGHIDAGEEPLPTAVRELHEELGLTVQAADLRFAFMHRMDLQIGPDLFENEWRWVYWLELKQDQPLKLEEEEVSAVQWMPLATLRAEIENDDSYSKFVPQGRPYFAMLFEALERLTKKA